MATKTANPWAYDSSDAEETSDDTGSGGGGADDTEEERTQAELAADQWEDKARRRFMLRYGGRLREEMGAHEMTADEHAARVLTVRIAVDAAARLHNRALVEGCHVSAATADATVGCKKKEELCPVCNTAACDDGDDDYHEWERYEDGTVGCAGARAGGHWNYQMCGVCKTTSKNHSQVVCGCHFFI